MPAKNAPTNTAIAYIRVSLAREIMVSPEQQIHSIDQHAAHNNTKIVDYIVETDKTGRTFAKRRIAEIIERVRAGEASKVYVWKFSRFGRNAAASGLHYEELTKAGGVLVSSTQPVDTSTPYGAFFLRMYFSMDELESDVIGMNWRETHERRRRQGLPHTGAARFGYMRCEHCERNPERPGQFKWCEYCKGVLVIDPVRGPALREAYERYVGGESRYSIAVDFESRGIRSLKNKPLGQDGLKQAMDSGFAAGLIRGRSDTETMLARSNPAYYDLWDPGLHEALIPLDLWERYKLKRLDAVGSTAGSARDHVWKYSVSGFLKCGAFNNDCEVCRRNLTAHKLGEHVKNAIQFRCPARAEASCSGVSVTLKAAEKHVRAWLNGLAQDDGPARVAYGEAMKRTKRGGEIDALERKIAQLAKKLDRNKAAYLGEAIELDEFRETRAALQAELSLAQARKGLVVAATASKGAPAPSEIRSMLEFWDVLPPHDRRVALSKLIRHINVHPTPGQLPSRLEIVPHWAPLAGA